MKIFQMDCSKARKKLSKKHLAEKNIEVINIPGTFEIPLMLKILWIPANSKVLSRWAV